MINIVYSRYLQVCRDVAMEDAVFESFRRHPDYTEVLEHVSYGQGLEYLDVIRDGTDSLFYYINKFATSDKVGGARTYWYAELKRNLSPTTLRYIKVLYDIINNFDSLDGKDIIEIGCGYGGQCKIIHDYFSPKSYTIVDLPEVLFLAEKFLSKFGIKPILRTPQEITNTDYDFFISNYAFTEINREYQDFYTEHIIRRSKSGYITCNFMGDNEHGTRMSKNEVLSLHNGIVMEERPLTAKTNFIYLWIG